jgi:hypothetical protein
MKSAMPTYDEGSISIEHTVAPDAPNSPRLLDSVNGNLAEICVALGTHNSRLFGLAERMVGPKSQPTEGSAEKEHEPVTVIDVMNLYVRTINRMLDEQREIISALEIV